MATVRLDKQTTFLLFSVQFVRLQTCCLFVILFGFCLFVLLGIPAGIACLPRVYLMPPASIAFFTSSIVASAVRVSAVVVIDNAASAVRNEDFEH